jgi:hypothetical protein
MGKSRDPVRLLLDGDNEAALVALLEKAEQNAADQMAQVSDWFGDNLAKRVKALSEGERDAYVEEAHYLFSEMKEYGNPHFLRNFFDYLFNKTRSMEDKLRRRFVLVTHSVYESAVSVLEEKTGRGQDVDSLYKIVGPQTRFKDLGFDKVHYEKLRKGLNLRIKPEVIEDPRFDREFYDKETVAEVTELITDINPLA